MPTDDAQVQDFAAALRELLDWVHSQDGGGRRRNEVAALLEGHLSQEARGRSVVGRRLPVFEQVNLQVALDAWCSAPGRTVRVQGLALPQHFASVGLQDLLHSEGLPPVRLSAPDLVDLPSGPDATVACWRSALLLVDDARGAYVLSVRGPERHEEPALQLEVAGLETDVAQQVHRELAELRSQLNVYRGQVLELVQSASGIGVAFPILPRTDRTDVVLPEAVLRRVERHTVDIADRREQLLAGSTVLMLSGRTLHLIGEVTALARELQPAVLVLEDVDLVAEDRGYGPGPSPVLFELLDAMDGSAADADLLFLLTTNRADLLEPALAARPGRVDVAVEIGLPDGPSRRRLFEVYSRGVPLAVTEEDVDAVVERTEGVTASFLKELLRRAVLEALTQDDAARDDGARDDGAQDGGAGEDTAQADGAQDDGLLGEVTGAHLAAALDDLLDSAQSVTRALLGVPGDQSGPPAVDRGHDGHGGVDWMTAGPGLAMPAVYRGSLGMEVD